MTKITHAPKEVIDELDEMPLWYIPADLLGRVANDDGTSINEWLHVDPRLIGGKQLAIINHVFGNECLQPERETRWYVETKEKGTNNHIAIIKGSYTPTTVCYGTPFYENGMTKEQAEGYAELFGGEVKEIK